MTIYFLFGKTGSGKSHISQLIAEQGVTHIEGDELITDSMRQCLETDEQITREMIAEFTEVLISKIKAEQQASPHDSFIVSQAMYLDEFRLQLSLAIPQLVFVWVETSDDIRNQRVLKRFSSGKSKVNQAYAEEMDDYFEPPSHLVTRFYNSTECEEELLTKIQDLMPGLAFGTKSFRL